MKGKTTLKIDHVKDIVIFKGAEELRKENSESLLNFCRMIDNLVA